jgi:chorismate mutase
MEPRAKVGEFDLMLRLFLISALLVSFACPASAAETADDLQVLRALMAERLVVMEQVAASKWKRGLPIEDKEREAKIVEDTVARIGQVGVEPKLVEQVITAQIEAAKMVQQSLFQQWSAAGKNAPHDASDLETSLRPKISRLSSEFITLFVAAHDHLDGCLAQQVLNPIPHELADFPGAWAVAVEGILSVSPPCPVNPQ